jgi:hypothetical protein
VKYIGKNSLCNCDYLESIHYEYVMSISINNEVYNNNKNINNISINIKFNSNFDKNIYYISLFFYNIYDNIIMKLNLFSI